MFELFYSCGPVGLSVLTIELIALLAAAWKAPAWVKEIGLLALVTSLVIQFWGVTHALGVIMQAGDISPILLAGGFRVMFVYLIYGLLIYGLSLVLRIAQKPRI